MGCSRQQRGTLRTNGTLAIGGMIHVASVYGVEQTVFIDIRLAAIIFVTLVAAWLYVMYRLWNVRGLTYRQIKVLAYFIHLLPVPVLPLLNHFRPGRIICQAEGHIHLETLFRSVVFGRTQTGPNA